MKKQPKSKTKKLPPSELYLEDVISIFELLNSENENCSLKFELDDEIYELSDRSELAELEALSGKISNDLRFESHGSNGYFVLRLGALQADVYTSVDNPFGRGVVEKLFSIIDSKSRRIAKLLGQGIAYVFSGILFGSGITVLLVEPGLLSGLAAVVGAFWSYYLLVFMTKRFSIIHFDRNAHRRHFFERNKDQIALMVISAIIGGVVALAVAKAMTSLL